MATHRSLWGLLLVSSLSLALGEHQVSDSPTVYDMLERYSFPRGILPEGVESYFLRPDGSFQVFLAKDCEFKVQGAYLLKYKTIISGTLESGSLRDLKGVSVKILLVWLGITDVVTSGDELRFYVGPLSASFPVANFDECPKCRCGFDCASGLLSDS